MKNFNHVLIIFTFLLIAISNRAQTVTPVSCGYTDMQLEDLANDTSIATAFRNYESSLAYKSPPIPTNSATYVIPVVFHIISGTGSNAIPYSQLQWQLAALNAAFSNSLNAFNGSPLGPRGINTQIQFCFAKTVKTASNTYTAWPTSNYGVMYYGTSNSQIMNIDMTSAASFTALAGLTNYNVNFPRTEYLNIWVVPNICKSGVGCVINAAPNVIGFAFSPWAMSGILDGVVMRKDCIGNNSYPNAFTMFPQLDKGLILAHEVGHYLGLFHPFETIISSSLSTAGGSPGCYGMTSASALTDGDMIRDTPPTTINGAAIPPQNTCAETYSPYGGPANENDQLENYMSYSDDDYMNTFTTDQTARMWGAISTTFGPAQRLNLVSTTNLNNTGVNTAPSCGPGLLTAVFNWSVAPGSSCTSSNIQFTNPTGPNFSATSYTWNFGDATTGSGANPLHAYTVPPVSFTVTCSASDGTTTVTYSTVISPPSGGVKIVGQSSSGIKVCRGSEQTILVSFPPAVATAVLTDGTNTFNVNNNYITTGTSGSVNIMPVTITLTTGLSVVSYSMSPAFCGTTSLGVATFSLIDCCDNLVTNGDLESGLTGFTSDFKLTSTSTPSCGLIKVNTSTISVPSGQVMNADGICHPSFTLPSNTIPTNTINTLCSSPGSNKIIFSQTLNGLKPSTNYYIGFKSTEGHDIAVPTSSCGPLTFSLKLYNTTTTLVSVANLTPAIVPGNGNTPATTSGGTSITSWQVFGFNFLTTSTITTATNFTIEVYQSDFFNPQGFDFLMDNISINELAPKIIVTPSVTSLCTPQTVSLTASGNCVSLSSYTLSWNPSSSLSCSTCSNPIASPSVTTVYTLVAVPPISTPPLPNIVVTTTVNVTQTPTVSLTSSSPSGICPGYSSVTLTATGAANYTWNPGSFTTSVINVSPVSTTIYTVTGANGSCIDTETISVPVSSVCVCTGTSGTLPSSLTGTTIIGGSYAVNSNLTINGNTFLSNLELIIAPNVSITVANSSTLSIGNCHLYSCFDMWSGITMSPTSRVIINNGSLIEDASIAINSDGSTLTTFSVISLDNVAFNRNNVGVAVSNYTANVSPYPFHIQKCVFTSRQFTFTPNTWPTQSTLSQTCSPSNPLGSIFCFQNFPTVVMKAPNSSYYSYYGITLNGVGATLNPSTTPTYYSIQIGEPISTSTVNYNIFDNLMYGISSNNSNLKVAFNVFQNSQSKQIRGNWIGGFGIDSQSDIYNNNYLMVKSPTPYNSSRKNRFYDCIYAVRTVNIFEHDIQYNQIASTQTASASYQQGKYGIYITTNRIRACDVVNNVIYNNENGITFNTTYGAIYFGASSYSNTQYVMGGNINTNTVSAVASGSQGNNFVTNAITIQNILSSGSTSTVAANLVVNVNNNQMAKVYNGISATNFAIPPLLIQNNTASMSINPSGSLENGIAIMACSNPSVQLNNILGISTSNTITTGIYASMNSAPKVTCNTVSTTYQGFQLDGVQSGTKWKGNSMTTHTLGMALTSGTIGAQGSSGNPSDNAWNGSWSLSNYQTYTSASTATDSPLWVQNTTVYNPTNNWGLPPTTSYFAGGTFTTNGAYSCAGGGARLMGNMNDDYEASYINLLEKIAGSNANLNNKFDVNTFIAQYQLYKALDFDSDLSSKSSILSNFYANNKLTEYGKILNGHNDLINGNYSSAISSLNSISSKNNVETNYSNFYTLYSKYCSNSFTDGDNENLLILANKCPVLEGEVIYEARALYNIANFTVALFKNNCPDLTISSARLNNNTPPQNVWTANIYPIPASNELFIGTNVVQENVSVVITDVNGRVVYENNVKTNNSIANIKLDMSSGIYFVTLTNVQGDKVIKKLVIAK